MISRAQFYKRCQARFLRGSCQPDAREAIEDLAKADETGRVWWKRVYGPPGSFDGRCDDASDVVDLLSQPKNVKSKTYDQPGPSHGGPHAPSLDGPGRLLSAGAEEEICF